MSEEKQDAGRLLSAEDRTACQQVAALDEGIPSQRAAALVAVDEGMTRAQAAAGAGLTPSQVGYALTLFRRNGMAMFPDAAEEADEEESPTEEASAKNKTAKKGKKRKKGKGKDKKKKAKAKKGKSKKK